MWALHERRRQRTAAKKAAEEALDREIVAMDATQREAALAAGKGKRKRDESDDEDAEAGHTRSSSRLGQARLAERIANRPARRRSTRNGESSSAMQIDGEEEWQKIPPEWLKSEDQEKDEDPDFGNDADVKAEDDGNESASDLSVLGEDEDLADMTNGHPGRRTSSRRSPRKTVTLDEDRDNLSDLSELSEAHASEDEDGEDAPPTNVTGEVYAQSAYNMGPSFDSEDEDLPEDFIRYEAICTNLEEWNAFADRFGDTEDDKEIALLNFVSEQVIPGVTAGYAAKEAEKQKKIAQRKAQIRKERQKAQQAALAAERAAERAAAGPSSNGRAAQNSRTRSSRVQKKELTEEEKREQALSERVSYNEKNLFANVMSGRNTRDGSEDGKSFETDRRALRARQREEEKRQREEAEVLKQLEEVEGETQPEEGNAAAAQDIAVPDIQGVSEVCANLT